MTGRVVYYFCEYVKGLPVTYPTLALKLLLPLLLLLCIFHHVLIRGREVPPYNDIVNFKAEAAAEAAA